MVNKLKTFPPIASKLWPLWKPPAERLINYAWCRLVGKFKICRNTLLWRHTGHDGVSNHQPHDCLPNRPFRRRSKKTLKLCVTGLCAGNSPVTGEFPAQMASNVENISIWWRHHKIAGNLTVTGEFPAQMASNVENVSIWWRHHGIPVPEKWTRFGPISAHKHWPPQHKKPGGIGHNYW